MSAFTLRFPKIKSKDLRQNKTAFHLQGKHKTMHTHTHTHRESNLTTATQQWTPLQSLLHPLQENNEGLAWSPAHVFRQIKLQGAHQRNHEYSCGYFKTLTHTYTHTLTHSHTHTHTHTHTHNLNTYFECNSWISPDAAIANPADNVVSTLTRSVGVKSNVGRREERRGEERRGGERSGEERGGERKEMFLHKEGKTGLCLLHQIKSHLDATEVTKASSSGRLLCT